MTYNNQNAKNNTENNKLKQIISILATSYPDLIGLNVASREIFYIIYNLDNPSLLFRRRVKLGRFLKTYRDLGFSIFLEMKKDGSNFDREIRNLKICMNKGVVETNIQNNEILRAEADYLDIEEVAIEHIRSIHNLHMDEEYKRILERTKDNGKRLTAKMLMDEYKWSCNSEIFRSLRKKIVIDTHCFFWDKIMTELIHFNIQGILDLSNNEIESIDEEFMKIRALKIDLRGNNLTKVPKEFENCNHAILDYDTEQTHLSPEVQALRDLYRRKNPINMKNIRNLQLKTTFRDDVPGNVSRLVGYNNIEDCDTMKIIINAHDQSEYSEFREIYRTRHRGPTDMELEDERKTEHSLKKDFSPYFMCN